MVKEKIFNVMKTLNNLMGKKQLSCGISSMYNKYIQKWDYIYKYDDFYNNTI